jgi:hypothetical protein
MNTVHQNDDPNSYYSFKLSDEQRIVHERLIEFFNSEKQVFVLKGYAGTGKTTIVHGMVRYLAKQRRPFLLMASTGRAAKVLGEKSRFPAATVHGSIYALQIIEGTKKEGEDEGQNYRIVFRMKMPNISNRAVFFVDESSMISNILHSGSTIAFGSGRLMDDLFSFVGPGKVVFIGDSAQLPPVNSKFSAALDPEYIQSVFGKQTDVFELKQVMRYKTNSGMYFNTKWLREQILKRSFPPLSIKALGYSDMIVYKHENELINKYYETIRGQGIDSAIYITLSNNQATEVNHRIRALLWGYKNTVPIKSGESLMVARNNYLYNLSNGDLITIDSIENEEIRMANLVFRYVHIMVTDPDPARGKVMKRVLLNMDLLSSAGRDLSAEQDMELLRNYFGRMHAIGAELYELMNRTHNLEERRNALAARLMHFKLQLELDQIIEKPPTRKALTKQLSFENMNIDPFLNALRAKYGYAITCHKAQGSEWPQVFLHLERALFVIDKENQFRWVYTALSRAEKNVHLLNNMCIY